MKKSKKIARANWKGSGDKTVEEKWFKIREELKPTEFLGYEFEKAEGVVLKIIKKGKFVETAKAGDEIQIIINQTPFYGESGGQTGDQGIISTSSCKINISDTQKKMGDLFIHIGKIEKGSIKIDENVNLSIDSEKRSNSKANHSATHLLHESLRRTLGNHVMQKGSLVSPERLRFDFSHNKPIEKDEMVKINEKVNQMIINSSDVQTRIMAPKEAVELGAMALFGEKYGDEVRVVFMGKENKKVFSTELCGGTHVKNTKEIGKFRVVSQSSIASGVRRVEALRDKQLEEYERKSREEKTHKDKDLSKQVHSMRSQLENLQVDPNYNENLALVENLKNLTKQLDQVKVKIIINDKNKNKITDKKVGSFILREQILTDLPSKELRNILDQGKKEIKEGIIIACCTFEEKVSVAVGITDKLTQRFDAVKLVKKAAEILGGKGGGGRIDFAQAGGANKDKIEEVFKSLGKNIS